MNKKNKLTPPWNHVISVNSAKCLQGWEMQLDIRVSFARGSMPRQTLESVSVIELWMAKWFRAVASICYGWILFALFIFLVLLFLPVFKSDMHAILPKNCEPIRAPWQPPAGEGEKGGGSDENSNATARTQWARFVARHASLRVLQPWTNSADGKLKITNTESGLVFVVERGNGNLSFM